MKDFQFYRFGDIEREVSKCDTCEEIDKEELQFNVCVDIEQADLNAIDLDTENKKFLSVVIMDTWLRKLSRHMILNQQ